MATSMMDVAGNPKYLKRKVKSGQVNADFDRGDLVLTYEVEATVVGDTGKAMQTERRTHSERLRVKLNAHTDVRAYAQMLVESNDLIPNHKVKHVEELLQALKDNLLDERQRADSDSRMRRELEKQRKEERRRERREQKRRQEEEKAKLEVANATMSELDEYVERMYDEDTANRIHGASMILQLASEAGNLEELLENDAMMNTLSRTVKEDYKKSVELATTIMKVFMSLSTFSQFHSSLHGYQVGSNAMQIVKWELERFTARAREMSLLEQIAEAQERGEDFDPRKGKKRGEPVDLSHERSKTKKLQRKQFKLLFVCLHVMINLSEDEKVERKMAKRGLVEDLTNVLGTLQSSNADLLILTATFLKKLSITRENKDDMLKFGAVTHLVHYLGCSNATLRKVVMSVLFNLSFDPAAREQMLELSLIPKLVEHLQDKQFRAGALRLLYHLSVDDKCKSMFTYTDVIPYVMRMLIEFPSNHVAKELAALAINLSLTQRNCLLMVQGNNFRALVDRAVKRKDPLLLKVVRNLARWTLSMQEELPDRLPSATRGGAGGAEGAECEEGAEGKAAEAPSATEMARQELAEANRKGVRDPGYKYRRLWENHVQELVRLMRSAESPAVMVEAMGTLACLTPSDLPKGTSFADVLLEHDLVEFLHKHLLPGFSEDDVLLEVVLLIGQFSLCAAAARLLANSPLIKLVYDLLHEKHDDAEIVLQVLFTFHRLLRHADTGHSLLYETQMAKDVCDLLEHRNGVVRVMADTVLDQIVDHDEASESALTADRQLARRAGAAAAGPAGVSGRGGGPESDVLGHPGEEDAAAGAAGGAGGVGAALRGFPALRGTLSRMVRARRFALRNREWLEMLQQEDFDELEDAEADADLASPVPGRAYGGAGARGYSRRSPLGRSDEDLDLDDDDDDDDEDEDEDEDDDESGRRHRGSRQRQRLHHDGFSDLGDDFSTDFA